MRWTQDKDVPKLKYTAARDAKRRGWHYFWEGHGFGVQVFASGSRKWIQCGSTWDPVKRKRKSYFRSLGSLEDVKLADARITAGRVKADAKEGIESNPKSIENGSDHRIAAEAAPEKSPACARRDHARLRHQVLRRESKLRSEQQVDSGESLTKAPCGLAADAAALYRYADAAGPIQARHPASQRARG